MTYTHKRYYCLDCTTEKEGYEDILQHYYENLDLKDDEGKVIRKRHGIAGGFGIEDVRVVFL